MLIMVNRVERIRCKMALMRWLNSFWVCGRATFFKLALSIIYKPCPKEWNRSWDCQRWIATIPNWLHEISTRKLRFHCPADNIRVFPFFLPLNSSWEASVFVHRVQVCQIRMEACAEDRIWGTILLKPFPWDKCTCCSKLDFSHHLELAHPV